METILKLIKALVIGDDGEVNKSAVQKIKDAILYILIGMALMVGVIYCMDDEPTDEESVEVVDD